MLPPAVKTHLLIVADDLSGAADCAITCAAAGLDTLVALAESADRALAAEVLVAEVLALDADTRRLPPAQAAARTAMLLEALGRPGQVWFKKFDSTLRGNIGAELAAILAAQRAIAPRSFALVAPAFPATGRHTRGGQQYLHGVPVEATEVWRREGIPGRAHMPTLLEAGGLKTTALPLDLVRSGAAALRAEIAKAADAYAAVVCDAETEADLRAIAEAGAAQERPVLWAGAAGLARPHLPLALGLGRRLDEPARLQPAQGPILFVVGSMSSVSLGQVAHLTAAGDMHRLIVPPAVLRTGAGDAAWQDALRALDGALSAGRDIVVQLGMESEVDPHEGLVLCHALAALVAPFASRIGGAGFDRRRNSARRSAGLRGRRPSADRRNRARRAAGRYRRRGPGSAPSARHYQGRRLRLARHAGPLPPGAAPAGGTFCFNADLSPER